MQKWETKASLLIHSGGKKDKTSNNCLKRTKHFIWNLGGVGTDASSSCSFDKAQMCLEMTPLLNADAYHDNIFGNYVDQ